MADWRAAIEGEWARRAAEAPPEPLFPLIAKSFDAVEITAMVETLLSGRLTMGDRVREFERRFAAYVGAPYAVMVNSGSSANLLAVAAAANPARAIRLPPASEVLVPAVCWSTSVWPLIQQGLRPVFVDVDPKTLNVDLDDAERRCTPATRGFLAVHILGNTAPMGRLLDLVRRRDLLLIEDTCESLGTRIGAGLAGSAGAFGTYSFYYSHHITTGEGGMVVCRTPEDHDLLRCLRAHGWSRELSDREAIERAHPDVDPRFLFVNVGYNVRPMEVQAAMGVCQLERIDGMNRARVENWRRLRTALEAHPAWRGQLQFPVAAEGTDPVWFGFPCLLRPDLAPRRGDLLRYLSQRGVENRPIVSGNFTRQPALKRFGIDLDPLSFPGAEAVGERGFFIGLHTRDLDAGVLATLAGCLLEFPFA